MDRPGPAASITRPVRALYGLGLAAEGVKNNSFNMFLLFYYQQVAGLDSVLTGVALFLALLADAVLDPMVGVLSDGIRSRFGRRHPFMYAASLPLALCFYAVFNPPLGAGTPLLFTWLLVTATGTRFSMALFVIPHQSLVAELTRDYHERTRLQTSRTVFAWLFGLVNALLAYTVFLKATPTSPYDPNGFRGFAIWGGAAMLVTTLISSLGTQRAAIAAQPALDSIKVVRVRELYGEIRRALESRNYRAAVGGGLLGAVGYGLTETMGNYMNLFFWGFRAQELAAFIAVIAVASLTVLAFGPKLASRFGKGRVAATAAIFSALITPTMVSLRILGALPPSGDPRLLRILCVAVFFGYSAVILGFVMIGAMVADVTDEHELRTGSRQEGLLFAAVMLIAKAASGLAPLVGGVVLRIAHFPDNAKPGNVPAETVRNLGIFVAVTGLVLGLLTSFAYRRYRLTQADHSQILLELEERRSVVRAAS